MTTKLTPEQLNALRATTDARLAVVDPTTKRRYVIIDAEQLAQLDALRAISNGIEQMEKDQGQPLADAMTDIRAELERNA